MPDFFDKSKDGFSFEAPDRTDIEFNVFESNKKEKFVGIHVDEHSRGWDQSGFANINIPADKWKEFVEAVNAIKVK